MSIKAIVWDLEGVLLHTRDADVPTSVARRLNVPVEQMRRAFYSDFNERVDAGEFTQDDFWNHILDTLDLPQEDKKHLLDFFYQDFFIDPEVLNDVRQYHQHYQTSLLSNYSEALRPMLADHWRMDGAFDQIVISCEVHMIKPHVDIYQYTLQKLGCTANEVIFIDDKAVNIDGARAVGMQAFQFLNRQEMNLKIREVVSQQA